MSRSQQQQPAAAGAAWTGGAVPECAYSCWSPKSLNSRKQADCRKQQAVAITSIGARHHLHRKQLRTRVPLRFGRAPKVEIWKTKWFGSALPMPMPMPMPMPVPMPMPMPMPMVLLVSPEDNYSCNVASETGLDRAQSLQ